LLRLLFRGGQLRTLTGESPSNANRST
jgi:hypothetical protein